MHHTFIIALLARAAVGQCTAYKVQSVTGLNCGIVGHAGAIGRGLSDDGWVCGWFSNCASYERPFYWPAGGVRTEIFFPFSYGPLGEARAHGVSANGVVVGRIDADGLPGERAFRFQAGQVLLLEPLDGETMSDALSVNSRGDVVGTSAGFASLRAVLWIDGEPTSLELPNGPNSTANDINDSDEVCGWMGTVPGPKFPATPFIWQDGKTVSLPLPTNAANSSGDARAINNRGDACGSYFTFDRANRTYVRQGCAWIGGQLIELGTLPGMQGALPLDINDAREIVGYATDAFNNAIKPFLWRDGVMYDLNDLVPPGTPFLYIAHAINDKGQVAGEAVNGISLAFLLTPALPAHAGDTDCDNQVNINDLLNVINRWNPPGPVGGEPADLNRDNKIDIWDLLEVIYHWGQ